MRHGSKLRRGSGGRRPLLAILPILVLVAFTATGCTKMTGGGWIESKVPGQKATFGFSVKCTNTTDAVTRLPAAVLHDGQFEFTDKPAGVNVHGDVGPLPQQTFPGQTCKQLAQEENLLGTGLFAGTFRTQSDSVPMNQGEFVVEIVDGGTPGSLNGDSLCVDLVGDGEGGLLYGNCGEVQGGNIKVE